jgi:hypothetical protein
MAESSLKDLISSLKGQGDVGNVRLNEISEHSRNSRRHLLEMKKSLFRMEEMVKILANPPEVPNDSLDEEERREKKARDEKMIALLGKIAGFGSVGGSAVKGGKSGGGMMDLLKGGAIAGIAATALKSAAGLVAMGVAIPAFFGGLLAGDAALSWMKSIGADFDFKSLKAAAIGFSDIILAMDEKAFIVLGGIMAASAVGGINAAKGVGAMGFAISAFLGGLIAGNSLIEGAQWLGADLNFGAMKKAMVGFSNIILGLSTEAQIALGGLIAIGGGSALLGKKPTTVATGVAALGAGISGFFIGLAAGDKALSWLGADYSGIAAATKGFSAAMNNLDTKALVGLTGLLAAGGLLGMVTDEKTKLKMVSGIGALSAGIAAFFAGFALADAAAKNIGDGSSAVTLVANFSKAVNSLDDKALATLGVLTGAGALAGLFGPQVSGGIAIGMTAIGAAIAGFFVAFDAVTTVASVVGVDGSNAKKMMTNMATGLKPLSEINGDNLLKVGPGLAALGIGMAAFFGGQGLQSVANTLGDTWNAVKGFFSGSESETTIERLVKSLKPLEKIDGTKLSGLASATKNISEFMAATALADADEFEKFAKSIGTNAMMLEKAVMGGESRDTTNGGKRRVFTGLANNGAEFAKAAKNVSMLKEAFTIQVAQAAAGGGSTVVNNNYYTGGSGGGGNIYLPEDGSPFTTRDPNLSNIKP